EGVNDKVLIVRAVMGARTPGGVTVSPDIELVGSGVRPLSLPTTGRFSMRSAGQPVGPTRELLAGLTGESLPAPQHVETGPSDANKLFSFLGEVLTLGIIPVMQITGASEPRRSYDIPPSDQAYLTRAPGAETLYRSFQAMSGTVLIFARPRSDDIALRATW